LILNRQGAKDAKFFAGLPGRCGLTHTVVVLRNSRFINRLAIFLTRREERDTHEFS
jgi:hypothetical protein